MTHEVMIKRDQSVDRFRAYGEVGVLRRPSLDDHLKRAEMGQPRFQPGSRVHHTVEEVILEGAVKGDSVTVDAGENRISRVVLYSGKAEEEFVVGSVDVNASGSIDVDIVLEPEDEASEDKLSVRVLGTAL